MSGREEGIALWSGMGQEGGEEEGGGGHIILKEFITLTINLLNFLQNSSDRFFFREFNRIPCIFST